MQIRRYPTYKEDDVEFKNFLDDLHKLINGGNISFGTTVNATLNNPNADRNIQGFLAEVADSGLANTSVTITHNLGYIPKCYDVKYISLATNIFDFGTPWTTTQIFLASSTAHTKFRVFIH